MWAAIRTWLELLFYVVVGFGLFVVASLGVALAFQENSLAKSIAAYSVNVLCLGGTAYWLGVRRRGLTWAEFGLRPFEWRWLGLALLAALLLLPVRGLLATAAEQLWGTPNDMQPRADLLLPPGPLGVSFVVTLLGAGLLVPLAEELYFRGLLHGWLAGHLPLWPRVLLSSAVFGLGHIDSVGAVASTFILGLICALALERSRSLWLPVILHAVNNSLSVIFIYLLAAVAPRLLSG